MRRSREEMEAAEITCLAPYAQSTAGSRGRAHPEARHPYRPDFQRDRDRIIHSRAFRRLEYKTQVFLNGTGDHLRTRLTHTIEVAAVCRTVARALALNEDLVEAIALAHDLGHPPFGHPGEDTLDRLMRGHGGFDHNAQSLRIVETVESPYPDFRGLNLTWEVIEGLQKHRAFYDPPPGADESAGPYPSPSLEAQIANLADEITYYAHDLDDGLDAGLITPKQLCGLELWDGICEQVQREHPGLEGRPFHVMIRRAILDREVADLVEASAARIEASGVASVEKVRRQPEPLIRYSDGLRRANQELRKFLYQNLYFHPEVAGVNQRACRLLEEVFVEYLRQPDLLGRASAARVETDGLPRTVCDYLSGMTDRYLIEEHGRLFPLPGRTGLWRH